MYNGHNNATPKGHKMTTTNVVGYAVYMELLHIEVPNRTTQVLYTPEGTTSSHLQVPATIYTRRLTSMQPKKQWRCSMTSINSPAADEGMKVSNNTRVINDYLAGLGRNNWKLYKQPIVVEVTPEDLEEIRKSKTPYKVLGRVWKSRKFLGFPDDIIRDEAWKESDRERF
jgi:hypothetical protein